MSDKMKLILGIVLGVVGAVALFSLVVCISCSANGLTFGDQICHWFGSTKSTVALIGQTPTL